MRDQEWDVGRNTIDTVGIHFGLDGIACLIAMKAKFINIVLHWVNVASVLNVILCYK